MNAYEKLLVRKERVRNLMLLKEYEIKDQTKAISDSLRPENIRSQLFQFMMNRPDLVIRAGYGIYKLARHLRKK